MTSQIELKYACLYLVVYVLRAFIDGKTNSEIHMPFYCFRIYDFAYSNITSYILKQILSAKYTVTQRHSLVGTKLN